MTADEHPADPEVRALTRSEEALSVTTSWRATERVVVRKIVTTEQRTVMVDVRREELHIERTPLDEPGAGAPNDAAQDGGTVMHEFVLSEEVPVVDTRVETRERVRVLKTMHTANETVAEELSAERIEVEGPR